MTRPTPTKFRILAGNPSKRPLPKGEPQPTVFKDPPPPPKHLRKEARKTWLRHAERLTRLGVLTENDVEMLEGICVYRQKFVDAARRGETLCAADMAQYRIWMESFGMSPTSRTKVKVLGPEKKNEDDRFFAAG